MIKKTGHIVLSFLLLVSAVGMTVSLHYCQDKIYDIGLFSQAHSCCDPAMADHNKSRHHDHCDLSHQKKSDCQDETITLDHVDNFVVAVSGFNFQNISFINLFFWKPFVSDLNYLSDIFVTRMPLWDVSPPEKLTFLSFLQAYLL